MRYILSSGLLLWMTISVALCQEDNNLGKQIVTANNKFAFDLYNAIKDEGKENIFISPLSVSSCMGMLYMMTNGSTAHEISEAMHFPPDQKSTGVGFRQCLKGLDGEGLAWANGIFLNKDYDVKQSYKNELEDYWSAAAERLDFSKEPKESREHINGWVANRTNQMIKDLLPESFPQGNSAMVLVSALHFKRSWMAEFSSKSGKGVFHLADGKTVPVDTMYAESSSFALHRIKSIGADVLKIPYKGQKQSLLIFQPLDNAGLPALEKHLSEMDLENDILKGLHSGYLVEVTMTKFKFEDSRKLQSAFKKLGINKVFSFSDADFSRASDSSNLELSEVYHKTMIVVDEQGTEAAGATGSEIVLASLPRFIVIDRPFMFAIIDDSTNLVTFLGRYTRPDQAA